MTRRSRTLLLSLALCLPTLAHAHAADPPAAPAASSLSPDSEKADALFRDGNAQYKQQKFAEAKVLYESAYRLKASHDIGANLAYAEMRLGDFRSAAEHLALAVRMWPPTGKEDKRKYAVERLQTAKNEVFALSVRVGVERAEVFVDGKSVGLAPLAGEIFLVPGPHSIEAKLGGYQDAKLSVDATKGEARAVALDLVATAPRPALTASTIATSPAPSNTAQIAPPPGTRGGPRTAVLVTGGVAAGAALVAGVVLTLLSNGKAHDANDKLAALVARGGPRACANTETTDCTALQGLWKEKDTLGSAAGWSFIGAGVLGTATLIYALAAPKKPNSGLRVAPTGSTQSAGIVVLGAW